MFHRISVEGHRQLEVVVELVVLSAPETREWRLPQRAGSLGAARLWPHKMPRNCNGK